jgi:hypothetical protein
MTHGQPRPSSRWDQSRVPGVIVPKTATVGERVFILPRGVGRVAHETSRYHHVRRGQ